MTKRTLNLLAKYDESQVRSAIMQALVAGRPIEEVLLGEFVPKLQWMDELVKKAVHPDNDLTEDQWKVLDAIDKTLAEHGARRNTFH